MRDYDSMEFRKYTSKSEFDKALHTLEGLLKGIAIDNNISEHEIRELKNWYTYHMTYINKAPFDEILPLIEMALEDNRLSGEEIGDILWVCNNFKTDNVYYSMITADIQRLQGLLYGILADNKIEDREINELKQWLNDNDHLANTYPYDEVYSLIISVLSDGKIDDIERKTLKVFFSEFIDKSTSYNFNQVEIDKLKEEINISGICAVCPEINVENNYFCFTGASSKTTRNRIKQIIESMNGNYNDNVIKNTNYLVIGDNGNPCWAFACYGRKVEKAIKMRKQGHPIVIIHENDFWDVIDDLM